MMMISPYQVRLQPDPFLNELTSMFERTTEKGSVWVTLKHCMFFLHDFPSIFVFSFVLQSAKLGPLLCIVKYPFISLRQV